MRHLTTGSVAAPRRQPVDRMPPSASRSRIDRSLYRKRRAPGLLDPLLEARLVVPRRHVGMLRRTRLLRQLRSAGDRPVISVVAPPGYGKSSLLVQWATEDSRPVAWLTADDSDSDPVAFLTDLAAAIDRLVPLGPDLFSAIASATVSIGPWSVGCWPRWHDHLSPSGSPSTMDTGSPPGRVSTSWQNWRSTCPKDRSSPSLDEHDAPPVRSLARRRFVGRDRSRGAGDGRA